MTETEFNQMAEAIYQQIEIQLDAFTTRTEHDLETVRNGNVLEIIVPSGAKIILNTQRPLQEIWAACSLGASHFSLQNQVWWSQRDQAELFSMLSDWLTHLVGAPCVVSSVGIN